MEDHIRASFSPFYFWVTNLSKNRVLTLLLNGCVLFHFSSGCGTAAVMRGQGGRSLL